MALARQTVPPLAAETERLHAREGYANSVGIVPVRGESLAMKSRLDPLDAVGTGRASDALTQPFKTPIAA